MLAELSWLKANKQCINSSLKLINIIKLKI